MNKEKLESYITKLLPIPLEKVKIVTENYDRKQVEKGSFLLKENKISDAIYFLESGCVRSYLFDKNGDDVTINIFMAPCFVSDFLSFFRQQHSQENIETLSHCDLWQMNYEQVQANFHNIPEFREFGRMMLVTNYAKLQERMIGMVKDTAETRYLKLLKQQPDIFQHVPLKVIASFLGITDTSLSRIRKELMKK
jgi:CRP-like cAMP-binding protein